MTNKKIFFSLILSAVMCVPFTMSAQVTIGSGNPPSQWSLLDLDNRERVENNEQPKALHLPRLDTEERRLLTESFTPNDKEAAKGLMIYRTDAMGDVGCLEFWNGEEWVSLCETDDPYLVGISLSCGHPALRRNHTRQLRVNATNINVYRIEWVTSSPTQATVDSNGLVLARGNQSFVIISAIVFTSATDTNPIRLHCRFNLTM